MTLKNWVKKQVQEGTFTADEVARHGCVNGFPGLTYYHETSLLHDKHEDEIWDLVYDQSADSGERNMLTWISTLNGSENVGSLTQLKNLLVWFAVEHYCWEMINEDNNREDADGDAQAGVQQ